MICRTICRFFAVIPVAACICFGTGASAQEVLLQIKPHVGDTLAMRLDQKTEMTGTPRDCGRPEACQSTTRSMTTMTEVFSRAIVRSVSGSGAVVLALTDSIRTASGRGGELITPTRMRGSDDPIELRVATDGGAEVIDADASEQLRAIFGQLPATLSRSPVSVGEKWRRQMRIPIAGDSGAVALVSATFQLDSLGANGDIAYISMRGKMSHLRQSANVSEYEGSMTGTMQLDRRLAWITESRAVIELTSMVKPRSGLGMMRVRTRVTQLLKAWPTK
ncbi:MAG: hypothetical protein ABIS03_04600 [Gemmatimonadaceae bacterium]